MEAVRLFPCHACGAKDGEIERLHRMLIELVNLARETKGLTPVPLVPPPPGPPAPALDATVELFLDARFVRGTPLHRQQLREAQKLAVEGMEPERIVDTLARGQQLDF